MQKGDGYTLFFAAAVCMVCSLLLSGAYVLLKDRQDAQIEWDRRLNVLKAFGVAIRGADGRAIGPSDVERIFAEHVREIRIDAATGQPSDTAPALPLYVWRDGETPTRYAIPVSGKGLWSTLYGYLALDENAATIVGLTFYRHGETPGLGGEIEKDAFLDRFKGKKVFANGAPLRIEIVKGKVSDKYPQGSDTAVDGISGATKTCDGVERLLNADLAKYEPYFTTIRQVRP